MMGERSAPPRLRLKRGKPPRMQDALLIKERRTGPGKSLFFKMLNKMGYRMGRRMGPNYRGEKGMKRIMRLICGPLMEMRY